MQAVFSLRNSTHSFPEKGPERMSKLLNYRKKKFLMLNSSDSNSHSTV
jgi:hypothetical protein